MAKYPGPGKAPTRGEGPAAGGPLALPNPRCLGQLMLATRGQSFCALRHEMNAICILRFKKLFAKEHATFLWMHFAALTNQGTGENSERT